MRRPSAAAEADKPSTLEGAERARDNIVPILSREVLTAPVIEEGVDVADKDRGYGPDCLDSDVLERTILLMSREA